MSLHPARSGLLFAPVLNRNGLIVRDQASLCSREPRHSRLLGVDATGMANSVANKMMTPHNNPVIRWLGAV